MVGKVDRTENRAEQARWIERSCFRHDKRSRNGYAARRRRLTDGNSSPMNMANGPSPSAGEPSVTAGNPSAEKNQCPWHAQPVEEVLDRLETSPKGLPGDEAAR